METVKKSNIYRIFYNKQLMKSVLSYLPEKSQQTLNNCFKKTGAKEKKKQIKEILKSYIIDFGKHSEKIKFKINDDDTLTIYTSIFNLNKNYLKDFNIVFHSETNDKIQLDKDELYEYLKFLPKNEFMLLNSTGDKLKLSKGLIPYDCEEVNENENDERKYEIFYENTDKIDFSNKESLIERQKKLLEKLNEEKEKIYYA